MNYTIKAAVFDMDGLLLDTEKICCQVLTELFCEFDCMLSINEYKSLVGLNSKEVRARIKQMLPNNVCLDTFISSWKSRYYTKTIDNPSPVKKGVFNLLDFFHYQGFPMAVATSTDFEIAEKKLAKVNLKNYFDVIVGGNQVERSKPAPDIYLKVAEQLVVDPKFCFAFEDSKYGLESALAASMNAIHIPDMVQVPESITSKCYGVFENCDEFLKSIYKGKLR